MKFKELIKEAKANGTSIEKVMMEGLDSLNELLCMVAEDHPEEYNRFVRQIHESIYDCHYNKHFAESDVESLQFTAPGGEKRMGAHWSVDQIQDATKSLMFPSGTTQWDKYVAFNVFYAKLCSVLDEEMILKSAHKFFFDIEEGSKGDVWHYMSCLKRED